MRDGISSRTSRAAAAALALLLAAAPGGCGRSPRQASRGNPEASGPVSFADLPAIQAALAERRGRAVFVNFWATWCGPCVEEMPQLASLAREYGGAGPDFIGISLDAFVTGEGEETEAKVRRALADAGVSYANLIYRGDQDPILDAFHLPGPIPYSVLYDRQGRETRTWTGPVGIDDLRRAIAGLH